MINRHSAILVWYLTHLLSVLVCHSHQFLSNYISLDPQQPTHLFCWKLCGSVITMRKLWVRNSWLHKLHHHTIQRGFNVKGSSSAKYCSTIAYLLEANPWDLMLLHLYDHVASAINYFLPILNHDFISGYTYTATIQVHMYAYQGQVPPPPFTQEFLLQG